MEHPDFKHMKVRLGRPEITTTVVFGSNSNAASVFLTKHDIPQASLASLARRSPSSLKTEGLRFLGAIGFGKSGWRSRHQSRLPPLQQNVVYGLSFSQSLPDFEGFPWVLRFPRSSKSTPSLIHLAVVLCSEVMHGSCSGTERLAGSTAPSIRPR